MGRQRFTEGSIVRILPEAELVLSRGLPVSQM